MGQPFESEVERLEQMIRGGKNDAGKLQDHENDHAKQQGPIITEEPIYPHMRQPTRTPWLKITASVSGAVVTGLLFGWFFLSFFTDELLPNADQVTRNSLVSTVEEQESAEQSPTMNGDTDVGSTPASLLEDTENGELPINLPAVEYHILQHGIFSDAQGAYTALQQLQEKGLSAASERREHIHVYAGIAMNEQDANILKQKLDASDAESFRKVYTVPEVQKIQWHGEQTESVKAFFEGARELVGTISRLTALQLSADSPKPFEEHTMSEITKQHRAWSTHSGVISSGLSEEQQSHIAKMDNALNTAVMLLGEYNQNPAFSYLWQAQGAIIQYVLLENSILSELSVM